MPLVLYSFFFGMGASEAVVVVMELTATFAVEPLYSGTFVVEPRYSATVDVEN